MHRSSTRRAAEEAAAWRADSRRLAPICRISWICSSRPSSMSRQRTRRRAACFATAISRRSTNCAAASREGKDWIAQLQQRVMDETGIKSLKIRYTSVFGYFIEVTKSNLDAVPRDLAPQADGRERRAIHHAGAEGSGGQNPRRGRAVESAGDTSSSRNCAAKCSTISPRLQTTARCDRHAGRALRRSPRRRAFSATAGPRLSDGPRRLDHSMGAIQCSTSRWSRKNSCPNDVHARWRAKPAARSSPARTWPANRTYIRQVALLVLDGADRIAGCPRSSAEIGLPTASSRASARTTIFRAGNPPSWSR